MEPELNQLSIEPKDTLRIETFSDGVFCIAVTLLSIEIGVELAEINTNQTLLHELLAKWPICLAYVISFINVLLAWMGHHSLFKNFRTVNNSIMISNGILLMLIALVPFPTKTLGLFMTTDALKTAVIFYTGYFVFISLAFKLLWYVATKNRSVLVANITESQIKRITKSENVGLICNTIVLLVAFVSPQVALLFSFIMWIYWIWFS